MNRYFFTITLPVIFISGFVGIIIGFGMYTLLWSPHRCSDFLSWRSAQRTYESNPQRYKQFDADNDGVACEHLQ